MGGERFNDQSLAATSSGSLLEREESVKVGGCSGSSYSKACFLVSGGVLYSTSVEWITYEKLKGGDVQMSTRRFYLAARGSGDWRMN